MKYTFILIGRLKEAYLTKACEEYKKRLSAFGEVEIIYLDEVGYKKEPSVADIQKGLDEEADNVLSKIKSRDAVLLIDLHGKALTSEELASWLDNKQNNGFNHLVTVIGSSYGLSDRLRKRADLSLKLSNLTFLHPHCLILMLEQIYRVNKILQGHTYHK